MANESGSILPPPLGGIDDPVPPPPRGLIPLDDGIGFEAGLLGDLPINPCVNAFPPVPAFATAPNPLDIALPPLLAILPAASEPTKA